MLVMACDFKEFVAFFDVEQRGVLDLVRTRLAQFNASLPADEEVDASA